MNSTEVKRRLEEAHSRFNCTTRAYNEAFDEHEREVAELRSKCPHERVDEEVSQVGVYYFCLACGQQVE